MIELYLGLTLLSLFASMIFSASEASIFSLSRMDLAGLQNLGLKEQYLKILKKPEELLFALLAGNELADYFASFSFATAITLLFLEETRTPAFFLYALLSFWLGDFFPKVLGFKLRVKLILKILPLTYLFYQALFPFRVILYKLYQRIDHLLPEIKKREDLETFSPVEQIILHALEMAYKEKRISLTEKEFIYGLFLSEKIPVSAIMTPRSEMIAFRDQPLSIEVLERLKNLPYNKVPIYQQTLDEVVGILYAKDLLKYLTTPEGLPQKRLSEIARSPYFVPENFKVRDLLFEFQRRHLKIALVVDEYGILKGLVTLEDILEELFGEILTEREEPREDLQRLSDGSYLISGKALLEEVREVLNLTLEEELLEDFKTINGLMLYLFQGIPREGESVVFQGYQFRIKKTRGRKVLWVEAEPLKHA